MKGRSILTPPTPGLAFTYITMNTLTEPHEPLHETARHAFRDLKEVTQHSLLEPIAQGTREVAQTAQSGCHAMAESTNYELAQMEAWAIQNPIRALGVTFGLGILAGIYFFRR